MNPGALKSYMIEIAYADGTSEEIEFTAPDPQTALVALCERKLREGIKLVINKDDPDGPALVEQPDPQPITDGGQADA